MSCTNQDQSKSLRTEVYATAQRERKIEDQKTRTLQQRKDAPPESSKTTQRLGHPRRKDSFESARGIGN
jgi:hypothetical protein